MVEVYIYFSVIESFRFCLKKIKNRPVQNQIRSRTSRSNPVRLFCPSPKEKQPQSNSCPLIKFIEIAMIKANNMPLITIAAERGQIPKINATPHVNSINGSKIAKRFITSDGKSL